MVRARAASIAAAPAAPAQFTTPAGPRTHTIQRGDTLWSLAARYYGAGPRWTQIRDANPGILPTKLRVGARIVVP